MTVVIANEVHGADTVWRFSEAGRMSDSHGKQSIDGNSDLGGLICGRLNTIENVAHLRHLSTAFMCKPPQVPIDMGFVQGVTGGRTGEEALLSQHRDLVREGEYVQLSKR